MKKIYLLLLMLIVGIGSTWADDVTVLNSVPTSPITTTAALDNGLSSKYYLIKNGSSYIYRCTNYQGGDVLFQDNLYETNTRSQQFLWKLSGSNGSYTFTNYLGQSLPVITESAILLTNETAGTYSFSYDTDHWKLQYSNGSTTYDFSKSDWTAAVDWTAWAYRSALQSNTEGSSLDWQIYEADVVTVSQDIYDGYRAAVDNTILKDLSLPYTAYSTNADQNTTGDTDGAGLAGLVDNNKTTYFHSSWQNGPDADHYIQADLGIEEADIYLYMYKRANSANFPKTIKVSGSNDGTSFTDVTTITNSSNDEYFGEINFGTNTKYRYVRFTVTETNPETKQCNNHTYFALSEFYVIPKNATSKKGVDAYNAAKNVTGLTDTDNINTFVSKNALYNSAKTNFSPYINNVGEVGYLTSTAYANFSSEVDNATTTSAIETAKSNYVKADNIVMPTSGNYYFLRNFGHPTFYAGQNPTLDGNTDDVTIVNTDKTARQVWYYNGTIFIGSTGTKIKKGANEVTSITLDPSYDQTIDGGNIGLGGFYMDGIHDPAQNGGYTMKGSGNYDNDTNPYRTVEWTTKTSGGSTWYIEEASDYEIYTVSITVPNSESRTLTYTPTDGTYVGNAAANGGFFAVATGTAITKEELSIDEIEGYTTNIVVSGKTITVDYTKKNYAITYNYVLSDDTETILYTKTENLAYGSAFPAPALPSTTHCGTDYYTLSDTPTGTVTGTETKTITVTQKDLPFTVSTSTDDATWYTMTIGASKKYLYYEADATSMPLSRTTTEYADADLFCFKGNVVSGFTIYNKAAGTNYVLAGPSDPYQGTTGSTAYVFMQASSTESICKAWDIQKSSNIDGGIYIAEHGLANNVRMNDRGSLAFWTSGADAGSTFLLTEVSNGATINYTLTDDLGTEYTGSCRGAVVGGTVTFSFASAAGATITQTSCTKEGSAYTYAGTIKFPFSISNSTTQNAVTIESALGNSKWCNDGNGNAIATNSDNTYIYSTNKDNYSWYIYPTFNSGVFSFKLYNVGAAKWMPTVDNIASAAANTTAMVANETSAGAFPFMTINTGNGFATNTTDNKFLSINSSSASQNIYLWSYTSGNGHKGSNLSFADLTYKSDADVTTDFNALKNTTKFDLIDGATVVSPSEYAAPSVINAAIVAAADVSTSDVDAMATFITSDNGKKIATFNSASKSYGAPLTTNYIIKASRYGTIILPVNWKIPSNWTVYSCSAMEGNTLTLTPQSSATKNTPYIVLTTNTAAETFQFIGYSNGAATTDQTSGLLTGSLTDGGTTIPEGSYVLATNTSTGKQAFYNTNGTVNCAKYKCYLTKESSGDGEAREAVIYFPGDDTPTAIESTFGGKNETVANGKYIKNGKIVIVNNGVKYNVAGQKIVNE